MTEEQLNKLDICYHRFSIEDNCVQETINARALLGGQRFDLYAIMLYIDHYVKGLDMAYAREVYKERTRAITGYIYHEDGNKNKRSFNDYVVVLEKLIENFKHGNYESGRTLVPVSNDYVLIDGAHRTCCAAYFNKEIEVLRFLDHKGAQVSDEWLKNHLIPEAVLDKMALEAIKWHDNLFMFIFWPKSFLFPDFLIRAKEIICNKTKKVYSSKKVMPYLAIRNLMIQVYGHMDWVGSINNDFRSTYKKADEVWDNNAQCMFIIVEASSCNEIISIKKEIRDLFGIGLASVHSTDNICETRIAANAVFNNNSLHFIMHAKPTKYKKSYQLVEKFKKAINGINSDKDLYIIDTSMVMAMYGLRPARDLDYYTLDRQNSIAQPYIEEHDNLQKSYYNDTIDNLMLIPENHFVFNEIKFVSLKKLLEFKNNRFKANCDNKDKNDIILIEHVLNKSNDRWNMIYYRITIYLQRQWRILKYKSMNFSLALLEQTHLYNYIRYLWRMVKRLRNQNEDTLDN